MKRLTTVGLQVVLGLAFLASAILKLVGAADDMRGTSRDSAVVLGSDGAG